MFEGRLYFVDGAASDDGAAKTCGALDCFRAVVAVDEVNSALVCGRELVYCEPSSDSTCVAFVVTAVSVFQRLSGIEVSSRICFLSFFA